MYHLGLWPEMENLKRGLAELAPTYDFTRYSPLMERRTGPVGYWPEAFHFSPALGELMVRAMTGLRTPDMPQNFGVLIESKNIESSLTAWRQERDDWIAQHPDLVERMRKAEDDFGWGVPFQAVTDAEIAAVRLVNPSHIVVVPSMILAHLHDFLRSPSVYIRWQRMLGADRLRQICLDDFLKLREGEPSSISVAVLDIFWIICLRSIMSASIPSRAISNMPSSITRTAGVFSASIYLAHVAKFKPFDAIMLMGIIHHVDDAVAEDLFGLLAKCVAPHGRVVTLDPCFTPTQSRFARWVAQADRAKLFATRSPIVVSAAIILPTWRLE